MVELQPSKLVVRVRFPSPAPQSTGGHHTFVDMAGRALANPFGIERHLLDHFRRADLVAFRRRYVRFFFRFPQIDIAHQLPERFFDRS
jgi:hypothetical protein